eukprot:Sspe_Gene.52390::Locus_29038_Transcript_1_3_Confidence_0.714_Length_453::g.52390::m.52390
MRREDSHPEEGDGLPLPYERSWHMPTWKTGVWPEQGRLWHLSRTGTTGSTWPPGNEPPKRGEALPSFCVLLFSSTNVPCLLVTAQQLCPNPVCCSEVLQSLGTA